MFKLKSIILLIFFCCLNITAYSQDNVNYKKASLIYFEENNHISRIQINKDTTEAFFRIVHKGMETEKKRNEAINKHKQKGLPFPNFYTSFSSVSNPKKIHSLKGLKYITVNEFRQGSYILSNPVYIIQKLESGLYLKWETMMWAQE